jgi:predicted DNA binding CopG/RHH family protein
MQSDNELEAFTRQLVKDKKTDEEKIKAIFNFVSQKIRYVAVLLGPYTHKPHPAREIFKKRYGDCKDKTTLLLTMLKIAGIEGRPVLVPARSEFFDESVPSLQVFNHVIAAVPSGNKYYWLDGTNEAASFDSVPFTRPTIVFVINSDGTYRFMETPPLDDNKDFSNLELESNINREGDADVNFTHAFSGKAAEWSRYFYKYLSPEQRKTHFERRGIEVKELNFSSFTDTNKPFVINLKGTYKNMAQKLDENTMVLTNTVRLDSYRDITSAKERKYPISFKASYNSKEKYIYKFPPGFNIKNLPKSFAFEKPYTRRSEKYSFHDSTFEISIEKKEFEYKIKLENLDDFKKYAAGVQDHEAFLRNIFFEKK